LAKTILEDSKEITTERAEEMMKDCSKLVLKTYRNLYAELKNTD
jgi:hypothetical protein